MKYTLTEDSDNSSMKNPHRFTEPIFIDNHTLSPTQLVFPSYYKDYVDKILIPHGLIQDRIEKIAHDILNAFQDETIHLICLLKGSSHFFSKLLHHLSKMKIYTNSRHCLPPYFEHYVRVKSYINDRPNEQNSLQVISEDLSCLEGKNILIVEDIIDTGNTLAKFHVWLQGLKPKNIYIASLLEKRTIKSNGIKANFAGFSVPDEFLIGFGLDYNEKFRDLDHLCILKPEAIMEFKT